MKKILALLLALMMAFALVACSEEKNAEDKGNTDNEPATSSAEELEAEEKKKAEEEAAKKAAEEEAAKKQAEEEAAKKAAEEEAARKAAEEEAAKKKAEEEAAAKKKAEEEAAAKKAAEEIMSKNNTFIGYIFRKDGNDLKRYNIVVYTYPNGGDFWGEEDIVSSTSACIEIVKAMDGVYVAPQDYSGCSTKVQNLASGYLTDFDAGMYGLSSTPSSWADLFTDTYFTKLGGVVYNNVKYLPVGGGGFGGGAPVYKYSLADDGTITLKDSVTGVALDYTIALKWAADRKTMTATVTIAGQTETVTLNKR